MGDGKEGRVGDGHWGGHLLGWALGALCKLIWQQIILIKNKNKLTKSGS